MGTRAVRDMEPVLLLLQKQLLLDVGQASCEIITHNNHPGVCWCRRVSLKPPLGLSSALTPESLPDGLGSGREHQLNHFCLQSTSFLCPGSSHEATPGLHIIPVARAGTQAVGAGKENQGRPKCHSDPSGLSSPSPYLSLKGIFKPFKMASSGFQGDGARVITAMETLSLASYKYFP